MLDDENDSVGKRSRPFPPWSINHLASTNFDLIRPISTNKFFAEYKQIVRDFHNPPVIDYIRFIFASIIGFPKTGVGDIHLRDDAMAPAAR